MIEDTGLETLCSIANTKEEILLKTKFLFRQDFLKSDIEKRQEKLKIFSPSNSAEKLIKTIFN